MIIRGAGVNVSAFAMTPEPEGRPVISLISRMLWHKGVGDFVAAARRLREKGVEATFQVVGVPDTVNPAAIPVEQLKSWNDEGVIRWLGYREDIARILSDSHIFCLPTYYREGLPKAILEAMASGRAVITCDIVGCREAVRDGENGLLVPPQDPDALAHAIMALAEDPGRRQAMGRRGRQRAENEFASKRVIADTLSLYGDLVKRPMAHSQSLEARLGRRSP